MPELGVATHTALDPHWCGTPVRLEPGLAVVEWCAPIGAQADAEGLIHGGFTFGVADFAAMLAVNDPLVLLASATTKFLAPVAVGDLVTAEARVREQAGRRHSVECVVRVEETVVLEAAFECVVARTHPLANRVSAASPTREEHG